MIDKKKVISLFFILFIAGCSNKISVKEEIGLQVPLAPILIGFDNTVYAKVLQQQPSDLTNSIYDATISKAMFFKMILRNSGKDNSFENDIEISQINSLCVMGKFLLSEKYKNAVNLQGDVYLEFYEWLSKKQLKWKEMVSRESPNLMSLVQL